MVVIMLNLHKHFSSNFFPPNYSLSPGRLSWEEKGNSAVTRFQIFKLSDSRDNMFPMLGPAEYNGLGKTQRLS